MSGKLRPRSRGVRFLARDSFLVDAASVVGTRAAVPGPGTLTTTDTNARMSISGGALVAAGPLLVTDVFHYTSTYTVAAGLAMGIIWKSVGSDSGRYGLGFRTDSTQYGINVRTGTTPGTLRCYHSLDSLVIRTAKTAAPHRVAIVLRTTGGYILNRAADGWKVIFPVPWAVQSPVYAHGIYMNGNIGTTEFDLFSVARLAGRWASATGIDSYTQSGVIAEGTAFGHTADAWIQFKLTTLPSSGNIDIEFRRQDANNCWRARIASGGTLTLYEVVGGVATSRTSGSVSAGNIVTLGADGGTFIINDGIANRQVWSSSTQWSTLTGGAIASLGTGGVIENLVVTPVTVLGREGKMLDRLVS